MIHRVQYFNHSIVVVAAVVLVMILDKVYRLKSSASDLIIYHDLLTSGNLHCVSGQK
jgi:hypothetical protein